DPTGVLWHNFLNYDSKKATGYVNLRNQGVTLKNQGTTCYLNVELQLLYSIKYFRKAIYQIPTEGNEPDKSISLAMQRVFYTLQESENSVGTVELTRSFGWDSSYCFMSHDVQEFDSVLLDKMKNTSADGAISKLFAGKMKSYVRCVNKNYESSRIEDYY
ncbi:6169_t:CDS:2, partial [Racocetra persica]